MIYKPKMDQKLFREQCAEIFSECNYEGKNIQVCTEIDSLENLGFMTQIRSVYIPEGFTLTLNYY